MKFQVLLESEARGKIVEIVWLCRNLQLKCQTLWKIFASQVEPVKMMVLLASQFFYMRCGAIQRDSIETMSKLNGHELVESFY